MPHGIQHIGNGIEAVFILNQYQAVIQPLPGKFHSVLCHIVRQQNGQDIGCVGFGILWRHPGDFYHAGQHIQANGNIHAVQDFLYILACDRLFLSAARKIHCGIFFRADIVRVFFNGVMEKGTGACKNVLYFTIFHRRQTAGFIGFHNQTFRFIGVTIPFEYAGGIPGNRTVSLSLWNLLRQLL